MDLTDFIDEEILLTKQNSQLQRFQGTFTLERRYETKGFIRALELIKKKISEAQ